MISDQIAPVVRDDAGALYKMRVQSWSGFGDETSVDYDLAQRLAREYNPCPIQINVSDKPTTVLGLCRDRAANAEYVELDSWAAPIEIGTHGVHAAALVHRILLTKEPQALDEPTANTLVSAALEEGIPLRIAIFKRLFQWSERSGFELPYIIYHLLPWEWFDEHLRQMSVLRLPVNSLPPVPSLPDLGSYFREVDAKIAPSIRQITEWRGEVIDWRAIAHFINVVWRTDIQRVPDSTRDLLFKSIKYCDRFLRQQVAQDDDGSLVTRRERISIMQARVRANFLLNRIRISGGKGYLLRQVQNLEMALVIASEARFLSERSYLLDQEMVRQVQSVADGLSDNPDDFLREFEAYFAQPKRYRPADLLATKGRQLNYLLYCAEVCKFAAQIHANLEDRRDLATVCLDKAESYYARAATLEAPAHSIARLHKRWARKVMVEAEIAREPTRARQLYERAFALLQHVQIENSEDQKAGYGAAALRARALFGIVRLLGNDEQSAHVKEKLKTNLLESDPEGLAVTLLADYYIEVEKDYKAALDHLDAWLEQQRHQKYLATRQSKRKEFFDYVESYAARVSARWFEELPAKGPDAVDRFALLLSHQPKNVVALDHLLDTFERLPVKFVDSARTRLQEHLVPLSGPQCPLTHAVAQLVCESTSVDADMSAVLAPSALALLAAGPANCWKMAADTLISAEELPELPSIIEVASKWYFDLGRSRASNRHLAIAKRLLNVGLQLKHDDVVWLSRRIEISLITRDFESASRELADAASYVEADPIFQMQSARLRLYRGQLEPAEAILKRLAASQREGDTGTVHPAVLDNLAILALQRGHIEDAAGFYADILRQNQFDARAEFGLGRTNFAKGPAFWNHALQHWRNALRLQATERGVANSNRYIWRTACSIAGLYRDADEISEGSELINLLGAWLREEDPHVISIIVDAVRHVGVTGTSMMSLLMDVGADISHVGVRKRIAQFLMGITISRILNGLENERDTREAISWCKRYGLFREFLYGARGSYSRALLTLKVGGKDLPAWIDELRRVTLPELRADELTTPFDQVSDDLALRATRVLVLMTAFDVHERGMLSNLRPTIALWRLKDLLDGATIGLPEVAGFVDRELLGLATQDVGGNGWRIADTRIERHIDRLPSDDLLRPFNDGGIYFRSTSGPDPESVFLYFKSVTSWSGADGLQN